MIVDLIKKIIESQFIFEQWGIFSLIQFTWMWTLLYQIHKDILNGEIKREIKNRTNADKKTFALIRQGRRRVFYVSGMHSKLSCMPCGEKEIS